MQIVRRIRMQAGLAVAFSGISALGIIAVPASAENLPKTDKELYSVYQSVSGFSRSKAVSQARGLGLSRGKAASLQRRVEKYISSYGGRQVSINRINLGGKDFLLLALPGEARAREVDSPAVASAGQNFCYFGYFCAYTKVNFYGDAMNLASCGYAKPLKQGFDGPGSWANNQTKGLQAYMYGVNGDDSSARPIYTTPGAYSEDRKGNWEPVWYIMPCTY